MRFFNGSPWGAKEIISVVITKPQRNFKGKSPKYGKVELVF